MYLEYNYKFECDDKIAPYIVMLNNKGYMTDYCCEGHEDTETVLVEPDGTISVIVEKYSFNNSKSSSFTLKL